MQILTKLKALIPKRFRRRKPLEIRNNIPKEKQNIRKTFGVYCNSAHQTAKEKLCPKCTALLAVVMTKMNQCPYGITKPICDACDNPCFGKENSKKFNEIMHSSGKKMFFRHPLMTIKHKILGMGVSYAKRENEKKIATKKREQRQRKAQKIKARKEKA